VDLTDGPPPQKKIWPEIKEAEDAPPPADAKAKAKADKEKRKKLIDVRNKLYVRFDYTTLQLQPCAKRLRAFGGFSQFWSCPKKI